LFYAIHHPLIIALIAGQRQALLTERLLNERLDRGFAKRVVVALLGCRFLAVSPRIANAPEERPLSGTNPENISH
jgi:hypothetical protein